MEQFMQGNKSLVMPPEKANEARKEQDPSIKQNFSRWFILYDKEGTKVTQNGQVLTGSVQTAKKILSEVEKKEGKDR